jgi:hypothetical protein
VVLDLIVMCEVRRVIAKAENILSVSVRLGPFTEREQAIFYSIWSVLVGIFVNGPAAWTRDRHSAQQVAGILLDF